MISGLAGRYSKFRKSTTILHLICASQNCCAMLAELQGLILKLFDIPWITCMDTLASIWIMRSSLWRKASNFLGATVGSAEGPPSDADISQHLKVETEFQRGSHHWISV